MAQFIFDNEFAHKIRGMNIVVPLNVVVVIEIFLHFGEVLVRGDADQAVGVSNDLMHEARRLRVEVVGAVAVVNVNGVILAGLRRIDDRLH